MGILQWACMAAAALAVGLTAAAHAETKPAPDWLSCPNAAQIDPRDAPGRDAPGVRAISPSAGARTSAPLARYAGLPGIAYDLYDVYDAGGDLRAALAPSGLQLVGFIYGDPGPDTERRARARRDRDTRTFYGFVADDPASGERLIVFRGTLQPNEWVRNLQARQQPFPGAGRAVRVHAGFLAIFESLELEENGAATPLAGALARLAQGRQIVFVGHSLGSAIATLAGVDASRRAPAEAARMRIVTFASPRVGDAGFAALARGVGRIDRVCNLVDVVTALPPSTRRITYTHVGTLFAVSSFDWPGLDNAIEQAGDQVLCWHSDAAYAFMVSPSKDPGGLGACAN